MKQPSAPSERIFCAPPGLVISHVAPKTLLLVGNHHAIINGMDAAQVAAVDYRNVTARPADAILQKRPGIQGQRGFHPVSPAQGGAEDNLSRQARLGRSVLPDD